MKKVMFVLWLLVTMVSYSQDVTTRKEAVLDVYIEKLELDEQKAKAFSKIYKKYKNKLKRKSKKVFEFNSLNKSRTLEFYELLNEEQFQTYKKIKLEIEPDLTYKFKG